MKYFLLTTLVSLAFLTSCRTLQNTQKPSAGAAHQSQEQQYKAAVVAKAIALLERNLHPRKPRCTLAAQSLPHGLERRLHLAPPDGCSEAQLPISHAHKFGPARPRHSRRQIDRRSRAICLEIRQFYDARRETISYIDGRQHQRNGQESRFYAGPLASQQRHRLAHAHDDFLKIYADQSHELAR